MSEAKPQRWFQIHLSTAVVMMLAAGAIMYENLQWKFYGLGSVLIESRGWPFCCYFRSYNPFTKQRDLWFGSSIGYARGVATDPAIDVIADVGIALAILAIIYFGIEYLIRRGEARKS